MRSAYSHPSWMCSLAVLAAVVLGPSAATAQTTYVWNQPATGGSWQNAANWLPSSGTPNTVTDIALFGGVATGANAVTLANNESIGELRFDNANGSSTSAAYTIGTNAETLTINNGAAGITVWGATTANQTVATNIAAAAGQPLSIINNGGSGVNTLTLSGALSAGTVGSALNVSGWSNTTISGSIGNSFGTLTKDGAGVLTLSAANSYTGGTVINGGRVTFTNDNQLGAAGGGVTLNGGALHVAADIFVNRTITLGANGGTILTTAGDSVSNPTFNNAITGLGSITFDGGNYLSLTQNNDYTGATIINNAGVILAPGAFGGGAQLSATSSIQINGFVGGQVGILDIRNGLVPAGNQVNDNAGITLNGGLLNFFTALTGTATENFGTLSVNGFGSIWANNSGGSGAMVFGNFSRTGNFSTLYVGGPVNGGSLKITVASGIPASGGSGQTIGIVPWIGGDAGATGVATGQASTLYTYHATNGLIALDTTSTTNFTQVGPTEPLNGVFGDVSNNAIIGNPQALNGDITILSLVQNVSSTTASTISGSGTLTVSSGAIANANQLIFNGPTLNFGSNTGYLWLGNVMGVLGTSSITGSNGVVVSSMSGDGQNELRLQNTVANPFSGGLYINGTARVRFNSSDAQLGAAGEIISLRGGTLWYNGGSSIDLSTGGTPRPIELHSAGGGIIRVETGGVTLTVPGLVSGTEQLTTTGAGIVKLGHTANTYSGGTVIGDATLAVAGPGSLGSGNLTFGAQIGGSLFSGGGLRFDGGGTYAGNINHAFSAAINTNGNDVTLSGVISGAGATLTKSGAGTLTVSGANTYAGNTTVSGGTLLVTNTTGSGTGAGAVTVNNGATLGGTGTVAGAVTVNSGGALRAGGAGGLGQLTLGGKTTLASGSSFQTTLAGTTPGSQYGQLVIALGGSIDLTNATFAPTLSYVPNGSDRLFLINNQNGTGGLIGTFNTLPNGATYTFGDGTTAQISYFGNFATGQITGGNDLVLHTFVPVPEPATVLGLAALALGGGAWWRRRKVAVS